MREILFRAKAINRDKGYHRTNYKNGDWVYGLITRLYDERFENLPAEMTNENGVSGIEIDHNTICQYTGLKDKNGRKIWENDVVKKYNSNGDEWRISKIIWADYSLNMGWCIEDIKSLTEYSGRLFKVGFDVNDAEKCEVIGNIFDNKELLEN